MPTQESTTSPPPSRWFIEGRWSLRHPQKICGATTDAASMASPVFERCFTTVLQAMHHTGLGNFKFFEKRLVTLSKVQLLRMSSVLLLGQMGHSQYMMILCTLPQNGWVTSVASMPVQAILTSKVGSTSPSNPRAPGNAFFLHPGGYLPWQRGCSAARSGRPPRCRGSRWPGRPAF